MLKLLAANSSQLQNILLLCRCAGLSFHSHLKLAFSRIPLAEAPSLSKPPEHPSRHSFCLRLPLFSPLYPRLVSIPLRIESSTVYRTSVPRRHLGIVHSHWF